MSGFYIHIPYCTSKCPYCAFNSCASSGVPVAYVDALRDELNWISHLFQLRDSAVDTVYFGGGTPSLLGAEDVSKMLNGIRRLFRVDEKSEITLEVNPLCAGKEKLSDFRKAGINRLSIGMQSLNNDNLRFLGRAHRAEDGKKCFHDARKAGFQNIGVDLIFALPHQKKKQLLRDLEQVVALGPEHISLYILTLEEDTDFHSRASRGEMNLPDDSVQERLFIVASDFLRKTGYMRYETSNYSRPGYESRHNMKYWEGKNYLGLGAGAHSYLNHIGWGMRWWNISSPDAYVKAVGKGLIPLAELELLTREEATRERVITALRTKKGLTARNMKKDFCIALDDVICEAAVNSIPADMLLFERNRISLTDKGALLADEIASRILR